MQAGNIEVDPVALYTADELYDLDDDTIRSRRRTSPAVYQELQARVRREHRALQGLVRTRHPGTGAVVDAVSVQLPAPRPGSEPEGVAVRLEEALRSSGRRFLPDGLAEVWTRDRRLHVLGYALAGDGTATCWADGAVVQEAPLGELLATLLRG